MIPQLNLWLSKLNSIRQQLEKIEKKKIEGSKNFIIESKIDYITNCLTCNYTCHYLCYENIINCLTINNGKYTIYPNKCHYTEHKNERFRIDIKMVKEKIILKDLEQKYYDSKSNLPKFEQIRNGLFKEFEVI